MDNPVFTPRLNATNAGLLRKYDHDWKNKFSEKKKEAIIFYTPKEIKKGWEMRKQYPQWFMI